MLILKSQVESPVHMVASIEASIVDGEHTPAHAARSACAAGLLADGQVSPGTAPSARKRHRLTPPERIGL